jgi:hypothetical protein
MFLRMPAHGVRLRPTLRLLAVALVAVALVAVAGIAVALFIAPALLLVVPLLFGRYPGERAIHRLAGRLGPARASGGVRLPRAPRLRGVRVAALAAPGAGRAPPVAILI